MSQLTEEARAAFLNTKMSGMSDLLPIIEGLEKLTVAVERLEKRVDALDAVAVKSMPR
jgi:hypothetical protein